MSDTGNLVVVVTGLSGAGKSTALHALEDLGFFCVDNLPIPVLQSTLDVCSNGGVERIAFGIDVRVRSFLDRARDVIESLAVPGRREVSVVFLDASDEALLRRFSSTRRPHPLSRSVGAASSQVATAVLDGIRLERERLSPLREAAEHIVDTTEISIHDLRRRIVGFFGPGSPTATRMLTRVMSFGFKYGVPVDADLMFDVRFLSNPHFVDRLRPLPGTDPVIRDYVLGGADAHAFLDHAGTLLRFCLPRYEREGKSYLTVAVGCTGGRHRSVVVAEELARGLRDTTELGVEVVHRDVGRESLELSGMDDFLGGVPKGGKGTS